MFRSLCLAVICSMILPSLVTSLRFAGTVSTSSDFTYIGKFAYGQSGGEFSAITHSYDPTGTGLSGPRGQKVALFPDVSGHWDTIEDSDMSCDDKLKLAGKTVYNIGFSNRPNDPSTNQSTSQFVLTVSGRRPHFWYVVLANCFPDASLNSTLIDSSTGLPVVVSATYEFELSNSGNQWTSPLSWDQQHIAEIAITFLIIYIILLAVLITSIIRSNQSIKSINQLMFILLAGIVFCQMMNQILRLAFQMEMIKTQSINQSLNQASWWFDTCSQLGLLVSVMILSSNNQSINGSMRRSSVISIAVMMCIYMLGYIASFVVNDRFERDHPSLNEWMFNNWGGYLLCAMRLLNIGVIVQLVVNSINQSTNQSINQSTSTRAVLGYAMFVSAWLASFPIITLIASMTSSYWRAKFFYGVNCVVCFTIITGQVLITYRNAALLKSSSFKTMSAEPSKMEQGEISMSDMNRSPNISNPSSPRSPQSPSQGFRSVTPV